MKPRFGLRKTLLAISVGSLLLYLLIFVLFSKLYLTQFYTLRTESTLVDAYERLSESGPDLSVLAELEQKNLSILIFHPKTRDILYNTQVGELFLEAMLGRVGKALEQHLSQPDTPYFISFTENSRITSAGVTVEFGRTIFLGGRLWDHYLVQISTSMGPIEHTAKLATGFLIIAGIATLILTAVIVCLWTPHLVRPVQEMTRAAERIAHLDFSMQCNEHLNNELGLMAQSINSMSRQMQSSIQALQTANDQLRADIEARKRSEEARKRLVSDLSHDLKTPIGLVAEGLASGMAHTPEEVREYCDIILDETDRMSLMISRMLELSRLESGTVVLEPEPLDLSELTGELLEHFSLRIQTDNAQLETDYPDALYVNADYYATEQVLTNLIQNALTYATGEKRIRVTIRRSPTNDGCLRITVFNNAAPIPEDMLDHLWDSFYRGETSRRRRGTEAGLGLAIVRSNMELMGMHYGVQNVADGVEFWFELPREG